MMALMKKRSARTRATAAASVRRNTEDTLVIVVRDRLLALGDFAHLTVYREGDHLCIAHRGPPGAADDDVDPVLRITHAGQWRFGLSLRKPNGRWQPVPIAGAMFEVLAEATRTFGPWLDPRPVIRETMETAY